MKAKIDTGQVTFSTVEKDSENGWRFQLYWPHFTIKNTKKGSDYIWQRAHKEFFFSAPTNLRIVIEDNYWGFGGNILGFGLAADYQKTT